MANDETGDRNRTDGSPLDSLLTDPAFLSRLSQIAAGLKAELPTQETAENAGAPSPPAQTASEPAPPEPVSAVAAEPRKPPDGLAAALSDPELMAKLPQVIAALGPMLGKDEKKRPPRPDKRTALLLALRPYLSPGRCEAIDYITKIGKLGDLFKNLKL